MKVESDINLIEARGQAMNSICRVLIAILGLDQHDFGAKVVTSILKDAGFEVIYLGKFQIPESIVSAAIEEDIDAIGISCHSWEYLDYVPELIKILRSRQLNIPVVLGGGTVSEADEKHLKAIGVNDIIRPGSTSEEIVFRFRSMISGITSDLIEKEV
jgi:methylmalonyl-CoA mutase C-terminal domain/subunit